MTDNTQPEALRLADALERPGYGWHTTPAQCAAVLRRLHTENEALRTQQPAPAGATPSAYVNGAGIKADDRPSTVIRKLDARFHDLVTFHRAEKFAASHTPPAEQQVKPGSVYAELPSSVGDYKYGGGLYTDAQMRDFADRTHALRMEQAAPKAEPVPAGEQEELREGASYESMNLAVMVLSDCGHSSNYKPLLERVAGRIDRHVERLLTAQQEDRALWAQAAPAAVAPLGEYPHEQMDAMALARYKVVPSDASMFWSHMVVAGDGTQQLYVGRDVECQNVARKLAGAFLDGAFAFHSIAAAPIAKAAPGEQNESAYQRGYMDGMAKGRRDVDAAQQQGYDAARLEIESLQAQLDAIGAGGVEPLRMRECLHKIVEPAPAPAAVARTAKTPSIFALQTEPKEGESQWGGIYSNRANAEHDAEVMRNATGREWHVVKLVEASSATVPSTTTEAAAHEWKVSHAYGGEICANCGAVKGTRRGNAPCGEAAAPTTPAAPAEQWDAPTDSGPISRQWLTVVYRGVEAGDEVQQICTHPKVSAMSWSHALHDRDAARSQAKQGANHD